MAAIYMMIEAVIGSAEAEDYSRLGIADSGTQVTIVIENTHVNISHYRSVVLAVANNIYLRDVLTRRNVELLHVQQGKEIERSGPVRHEEPPAILLLGPEQAGSFVYEQEEYPFTLTLKRALDVELITKGRRTDEWTGYPVRHGCTGLSVV